MAATRAFNQIAATKDASKLWKSGAGSREIISSRTLNIVRPRYFQAVSLCKLNYNKILDRFANIRSFCIPSAIISPIIFLGHMLNESSVNPRVDLMARPTVFLVGGVR